LPAISLALVSGLYFALTVGLTIDWNDEGQIVYLSRRVAQGAVPYRDFHHVYGPSLFLLNGLLFRLFGADLLVLRIALVLVKCGTVVLTFLLARRVSSLPIAIGSGVLLTVVWGADWPFFSTPYASYFALSSGLAAILLVLTRRESIGAYLGAGVCIGVAATFKQTTGAFLFLSAVAYVMSARGAVESQAGSLRSVSAANVFFRSGALLSIVGFAAAILIRIRNLLDALILGAASVVLLVGLLFRERRDPPPEGAGLEGARRASALSVGAAIPLLGCALYFAHHGALGALVSDTILDLPAEIIFLVRPEPFHAAAFLWTVFLVAALVTLRRMASGGTAATPLVVCGAAALLALGLSIATDSWEKVPRWWRDVVFGIFALTPLSVALSSIVVVFGNAPSRAQEKRSDALRMIALVAAIGLLNLVPAADIWHVFLALPVFLPVFAAAIDRALPNSSESTAFGRHRALAYLLLVVMTGPMIFRFSDPLNIMSPRTPTNLQRATGVRLHHPGDLDGAALVRFLQSDAQRDRSVLVLTGQHMLYFLADRESPIDREEFVLYLIGFDLISAKDVSRRVDASRIVDALELARPLVIEERARGAPHRVREMIPALGDYVDRNYRETLRFGRFRVLDRAGR